MPNVGSLSSSDLRGLLAQTRQTVALDTLTALPPSVTDVRLFRVGAVSMGWAFHVRPQP